MMRKILVTAGAAANMMGVIRNAAPGGLRGEFDMVRYAADHKEKTRAAIVEATALRIASGGFEAAGVASIMAEVGLTHGGFYAHFRSRDALLAAAVERLFARGVETLDRLEEKYGEGALGRYLDFYLSARHRDDAAGGCPIPALAAEARNAAPVVKAAFDAGLERLADRLARLMPGKGGRKAALGLLAEMAGVVSLARAMGDAKASGELLAGKRKALA
jgi:TetR/AcrR family transcriptional repressor of nem operon